MLFIIYTLLATACAQPVNPCSTWQLPWGNYTGALDANNVCLYSDVRFAAPPTGNLRFAAPQYPPSSTYIPAPGPDVSCIQLQLNQNAGEVLPPTTPNSAEAAYGTQSEDCLFLDVYIPPSAFKSTSPVPVVVWFYGGAYIFGSKTNFNPSILPFYVGDGFINTAKQPMIFVAGNYRLGAFGWLAGSYMEHNAQPNAGLLDQRSILRFVNDYLKTINSPNLNLGTISLWGESAGASSIMHQLAMPGNIQQPLFQRAILQSPAYQWLWERDVGLDLTFNTFALNATSKLEGSCANSTDIACVRQADSDALQLANLHLAQGVAATGIFPVGPSVDGNLVPNLATYQFSQNQPVMKLDSIIVSHVDEEVSIPKKPNGPSFIPLPIRLDPTNETKFNDFIASIFPGQAYTCIVNDVLQQYPSSNYKNQVFRAQAVIRDSSFVCNTRFIIDHYMPSINVYAMDYSLWTDFGAAVHASDLLPTFANAQTNYTSFIVARLPKIAKFAKTISGVITNQIRPRMQKFFTGHAIWGDPNHGRGFFDTQWFTAVTTDCANGSTCIGNVMRPKTIGVIKASFPNKYVDPQTVWTTCSFWDGVVVKITNISNGQNCTGEKQRFQSVHAPDNDVDQSVFNEL